MLLRRLLLPCSLVFGFVVAASAATTRVCIVPDIQFENGGNGRRNYFGDNMVPWMAVIQGDGKPRCEVALFMGDMKNDAGAAEYIPITTALNTLLAAGVKIVPLAGNHDTH